jgi:hypothetical protein
MRKTFNFRLFVVIVVGSPLAAGLFVAGLLAMGDPGPRGEIAVSTSDGMIRLRVQLCDNTETVRSVALLGGIDGPGQEGETLWKIESARGSSPREFVVGNTPPGFVESVPLGALDRTETYVAEVVKGPPGGLDLRTGFVPNSLQPSRWETSEDKMLTDQELDNLRPCD